MTTYIRNIIYVLYFYKILSFYSCISCRVPIIRTVVIFGHIKFMSTLVRSGNSMSGVCLCIASRVVAIDEQETESSGNVFRLCGKNIYGIY